MPLLALLLILVLPFQSVDGFVTRAPPRSTYQSQLAMDHVSSQHSHQRLMAWSPVDPTSSPLQTEMNSNAMSLPLSSYSTENIAVARTAESSTNFLHDGGPSALLRGFPSQALADVQTESFVPPPAVVQENDFVQTMAVVQGFVEQLPDSAKITFVAVLALLVAYQTNSNSDQEAVDSNVIAALNSAKDKEIEAAVENLSQTVVVLTQEIKAIKDTTDAPRKLKQLQLQNAALEQELQSTVVKARTLSTVQEELYQGIEDVNGTPLPAEIAAASAITGTDEMTKESTRTKINGVTEANAKINGAVADESSRGARQTSTPKMEDSPLNGQQKADEKPYFAEADGETEEEYSDLLLAAMVVGFFSWVFSNF